MQSLFPKILAQTLTFEGGFTKDTRDPGNWTGGKVNKGVLKGTKKGIAAHAYPNLDIEHLNDNEIATIYRRDYWDKMRCDDLPAGVDGATFDAGVNSGIGRGARWLQRAVGAVQDGKVGPNTVRKARVPEPADTVGRICDYRLGFLQALTLWKTFGRGWGRRVAEGRVFWTGLALAHWPRGSKKAVIEGEAGRTATRSKASTGSATATGGAGVAAGADHSNGADAVLALPDWVVLLLFGVVAVVVFGFIVQSIWFAQSAKALRAEAAKLEA